MFDIINEYEEENWSKDRPLGNTTDNQGKEGQSTINYNWLSPVGEEGFYPLNYLWMDAIKCKFLHKELVVYLVEGFGVIKIDGVKVWVFSECFQDIIKMMQ